MTLVRTNIRVVGRSVHLRFYMHSMKRLMIECSPFQTSTEHFLAEALDHTGLRCKPPQSIAYCEWIFDFSEDVTSTSWNKLLPVLVANLTRLQDSGTIRYAEWTPRIR